APTADIVDVTPDPRATSVNPIAITFNQVVAGFDVIDLVLKGDGVCDLVRAGRTLSSADNITWILGNLSGLTELNGMYVLTLTASGSGIQDLAGNLLATDASDTWVRANSPPVIDLPGGALAYTEND